MAERDSMNQLPLFEFDEKNVELRSDQEPRISESPFSKYIVYVDESGDHSLTSIDDKYPIFVLSFCVFHKRHYSEAVVAALEKFKFNYFGHDQVVLHENDIRKEKPPFNIFKGKTEKDDFFADLTSIIDRYNFILISCIIDKRSVPRREGQRDNPYHLALGLCMDKLYDFLFEKDEHQKKTHVVFECRGKKEDKELELEFRRICGENNKRGINFPFEILISDKKVMSSGLQLADLVSRPVGINYLRTEQENRAFAVLRKKFYCKGGRKNVGKNFENKGLIIYPPFESEKPR